MDASFRQTLGIASFKGIRDGIVQRFPLIIIGSLFFNHCLTSRSFARSHGQTLRGRHFDSLPADFGVDGVVCLASASGYGLARSYDLDGITGGLLSAATFIMATLPVNLDHLLPENKALGWLLPVSKMGGSGLFMSIIAMFIAVETMHWLKKSGFSIRRCTNPFLPPCPGHLKH